MARLVAKGFTQKEVEDFFDTYSPIAQLTTLRVLLSLAAFYGLLVHQMDISWKRGSIWISQMGLYQRVKKEWFVSCKIFKWSQASA